MKRAELKQQAIDYVKTYYGEDVSEDDANEIKEYVENKFDHCEVEVHYGGQPLYYYLISVE